MSCIRYKMPDGWRNHWAKCAELKEINRKRGCSKMSHAIEEKTVKNVDWEAVLLQEKSAQTYGSVSLTQTQQRYAQIEEANGRIYGLEHFNYYTYGRSCHSTDRSQNTGPSKKPYDTISLVFNVCYFDSINIIFSWNMFRKEPSYSRCPIKSTINPDKFDEVLAGGNCKINLLTQASPN
ncbi:hypothetical protein NPIL_585801 [Nephila pilipes]|uniref:Uncharacterized protein n=1 Tax=Nephila pilipes TaxID=299642 RepID=A0A8X6QMR0_NEPPI|nr:hypothetical protein NPIL_585801 [Nephila pilipes]